MHTALGRVLRPRPCYWRYMHLRSLIFLLALLVCGLNSYACSVPKTGIGWSKNELIDNSDVIVVAQLDEVEESDFLRKYTLIPVEGLRLRGSIVEVVFWSGSEKHYDTTFNNHKDEKFWENGVGRSGFPCCICGPDHTFREGEYYLLFPNAFGAWKSAEIIKNFDEDEWYKYVVNRISK